jgi:uridine kinase
VREQLVNHAGLLLDLARSRGPTLGRGRLICVDGPAGSGKTTLAGRIAALDDGATVVHMDDLFEGWGGLARLDDQLGPLLLPLADGSPGSYRRWDWHAGGWAETVQVSPSPLLVLEGVGSGAAAYAGLVTVLAWVDAPHDLRMRRAIERDGAALADHWAQWARDEQALFAREHTRERADVVLDSPQESPTP